MKRFWLTVLGGVLFIGAVIVVLIGTPSGWRSGDRSDGVARRLESAPDARNPSKSPRRLDARRDERSKAWMVVQEIEKQFGSDVLAMTEASHRTLSLSAGKESGVLSPEEWNFKGYTNDAGLEPLTVMNTREGVQKLFDSLYEQTGDESFFTDSPNRTLVVNLLASENKRYDLGKGEGPETEYPFLFTLTILQR